MNINLIIKNQEWYQELVEECRAIIVETVYISRTEAIKGKHQLGERIATDPNYKKYIKGNQELIRRFAADLGISRTSLYYCIQFYEKYPDVSTAVETFEEQKNISWRKIRKKYLPAPPEERFDIQKYIRPYNLWSFAEPLMGFGKEYPGRMPAQIVINLLWYFTNENDLVIDPMAGGGTTIDVCKIMNRKIKAFDIKPIRDDIKQWDITLGFPEECSNAKLIILDPPYWQQKKGSYSGDKTNLANLSLIDFYNQIENILVNAGGLLVNDGYIAFIIGGTIQNMGGEDHAIKCYNIASLHYTPVYRIIIPYPTQQYTGYDVTRAKTNKQMLNLYRDLMIFKGNSKSRLL